MPHTASSPWLVKGIDIDGDGAKDLVIVDTEGDHPIHVRFATDEKKLGPEQRFALDVPHAIAFGQIDGKGGSEILVLEGQLGPGQGAHAGPVGRPTRPTSAAGWRSSRCRRGPSAAGRWPSATSTATSAKTSS